MEPDPQSVLDREPVLIVLGAVWLILAAGLAMANRLGWTHLDTGDLAAIGGFVTPLTGTAAAVIRSRVYSPATVKALTAGDS